MSEEKVRPDGVGFYSLNKSNKLLSYFIGGLFLFLGLNAEDDKKSELKPLQKEITDKKDKVIGFVEETLGTLTGGLIGTSEALPIFNFFKNIPKSALRDATTSQKIANYARTFGTGAVQEGFQEATAGLARDLTAKGFFSNELSILIDLDVEKIQSFLDLNK